MLQINNILLARDFSSISDRALHYALYLAEQSGATLHLLYAEVLHEDPFAAVEGKSGSPEARIRERLRLDPDGNPLTDSVEGLKLETAVVRDIAAGPAILNYAADHDADIIVLGTHGRRGVRRLLLGSVAEEVVRQADCPVLTVRGAEEEAESAIEVHSILVPVDFSKYSREALRYAREIGALYDARLDLLHVIEEQLHPAFYVGGVESIYDLKPNLDEEARSELQKFFEETEGPEVEATYIVKPGRAPRRIVKQAQEAENDLVVMSTHGLTGLDHFLMGSVAEKVVRRVPVPVFTVKAFGKSIIKGTPAQQASASE